MHNTDNRSRISFYTSGAFSIDSPTPTSTPNLKKQIHEILTESQLIAERLILNESYFRNEIKVEHGE
jgi:hypothetical protein